MKKSLISTKSTRKKIKLVRYAPHLNLKKALKKRYKSKINVADVEMPAKVPKSVEIRDLLS
jgi:hypothetical protein